MTQFPISVHCEGKLGGEYGLIRVYPRETVLNFQVCSEIVKT